MKKLWIFLLKGKSFFIKTWLIPMNIVNFLVVGKWWRPTTRCRPNKYEIMFPHSKTSQHQTSDWRLSVWSLHILPVRSMFFLTHTSHKPFRSSTFTTSTINHPQRVISTYVKQIRFSGQLMKNSGSGLRWHFFKGHGARQSSKQLLAIQTQRQSHTLIHIHSQL